MPSMASLLVSVCLRSGSGARLCQRFKLGCDSEAMCPGLRIVRSKNSTRSGIAKISQTALVAPINPSRSPIASGVKSNLYPANTATYDKALVPMLLKAHRQCEPSQAIVFAAFLCDLRK